MALDGFEQCFETSRCDLIAAYKNLYFQRLRHKVFMFLFFSRASEMRKRCLSVTFPISIDNLSSLRFMYLILIRSSRISLSYDLGEPIPA